MHISVNIFFLCCEILSLIRYILFDLLFRTCHLSCKIYTDLWMICDITNCPTVWGPMYSERFKFCYCCSQCLGPVIWRIFCILFFLASCQINILKNSHFYVLENFCCLSCCICPSLIFLSVVCFPGDQFITIYLIDQIKLVATSSNLYSILYIL